jgi:stage II sporulation protein D
MQIRVGLKTGDLVHSAHKVLTLSSSTPLRIAGTQQSLSYPAGIELIVRADGQGLLVGSKPLGRKIVIQSASRNTSATFKLSSSALANSPAKPPSSYRGILELTATGNLIVAVLETDLESYVQGVLQSEVPAYFNLEAMKAQAVLARTYGINPRLSHRHEGFDVCDSYLHCQAFYGLRSLSSMQSKAISSTQGELLLDGGKPALALFSACAGGHTENYEDCFSDPTTNAFPPNPIPYLKGVPEGILPQSYPSEAALKELFADPSPKTDDAWSKTSFRWTVRLTGDALEAHMHHIIEKLQTDPQFGPFIKAPASGKFGHIQRFEIARRGVAGTAMELLVHTSAGAWLIRKELTIRSIFENPDVKLKRLRSAKVLFDQTKDSLGLLGSIIVRGFGSGHGVGLQQVGAQGLGSRGLDYKQIIAHYYVGAEIGKLPSR